METKQTNKKWKKCKDCGGRIYDHRPDTHECPKAQEEQIKEQPVKKSTMTIEETKLGVTIVLSKEDCYALDFLEGTPTRNVVKEIRKRLGLPDKKKKGDE